MRVLGALEHFEVGKQAVTQTPLGQHALDGFLKNPLRYSLIDLSERLYFQSSRLGGGMAAIKLVIELVSSDSDFVCIDDYHVAAHVHGRAIAWQIFASDNTRGQHSQSP